MNYVTSERTRRPQKLISHSITKYYSLTTNRLRDMILLQIRLSVNDFSGVGKQKMCVNLILFEMFKFLKTPFCFLVCFFMCSLKY